MKQLWSAVLLLTYYKLNAQICYSQIIPTFWSGKKWKNISTIYL